MPVASSDILFAWAHLSDLHVGGGGHARTLLLAELARDLARPRDDGSPRPGAIFITGDVAWSGAEAEYAEARTLLAQLASAAEIGLDRVYVVPGEHDVDHGAGTDTGTARLLRALQRGEEKLDAALESTPIARPCSGASTRIWPSPPSSRRGARICSPCDPSRRVPNFVSASSV